MTTMTRRTLLAGAIAAPVLYKMGGSVSAQSKNSWRLLNIIATKSTAPGFAGTMTRGEKSHAYTMINALPGHISAFSGGLGGLRQTTVESKLPVTQVSADGGGDTVWVSPSDAAAIYDKYGAASYDMVCLWTSGSVLRSSYSGLTVAGPYPNGASYIPVGDDPTMNKYATLPTHELAWQLCAYWIPRVSRVLRVWTPRRTSILAPALPTTAATVGTPSTPISFKAKSTTAPGPCWAAAPRRGRRVARRPEAARERPGDDAICACRATLERRAGRPGSPGLKPRTTHRMPRRDCGRPLPPFSANRLRFHPKESGSDRALRPNRSEILTGRVVVVAARPVGISLAEFMELPRAERAETQEFMVFGRADSVGVTKPTR